LDIDIDNVRGPEKCPPKKKKTPTQQLKKNYKIKKIIKKKTKQNKKPTLMKTKDLVEFSLCGIRKAGYQA
jgi:hypothetical protein